MSELEEITEKEVGMDSDTALKLATVSSRHTIIRRWILKNRSYLAELKDKQEAKRAMKALELIYRAGYEAGYGAGGRAAKKEVSKDKGVEQ